MQRITRTILWAVIFGALNLLAQAPDSASSPQKLAADQTFAPVSGVPVLTVDEAIAQAVAKNSGLRIADLEIRSAADDLAANRTRRFANTQIIALGGQPFTKPSVTFQQGSLGVYPATGPIRATNQTINVARKPAGAVFASVTQPLSTQYGLHLQLKTLAFCVKATRQDQQKRRLEVVDQVRRAYYAVVQAQSALDSLEASLSYYEESKQLAAENLNRETTLASDLLGVDAQLLKIQSAVSDARDQVAPASERLNDLMGRDIHTQFRVISISGADAELETPLPTAMTRI